MNEFQFIFDFIAPGVRARSDVLLGIGDDGALLAPPPGETLIVVADTLVVDRHFPATLPAADIGYRAAATNLSDIAAMGGEPRWATLALTLPEMDAAWAAQFLHGLFTALDEAGVALVGGDTTRGPLTITVQIIGSVPPGQALTRRGARPGDRVYVSGTLGDAAAALRLLAAAPADAASQWLIQRFCRPTARLALGRALRGLASACVDVSDGLLADLGHIATQSGCGMRLDASRLPLSDPLRRACAPAEHLLLAASGGDDYELAFTVPAARSAELDAALALGDAEVTCIGQVVVGEGVVLVDDSGFPITLAATGYRHF